ncbi:MAG: hypothetical protein IAG10_04475 [Planctomycetaceae bacterium]|nr:hypothetical protein [Planctomycetaceae bacterium]
MRATGLALLLCSTFSLPAFGQQVAVQQPVVGTTSVSTSVAVPNRGQILLGGVSSAQSGRSRFGFVPFGSSVGTSRSSRSLSVGVTIIDLREMDEAILNSVPDRPSSGSRYSSAISAAPVVSSREQTRAEEESPTDRAAKFERLARKAEAENHPGVAKLHWQMAAKYGSATARERRLSGSR